jgi:hypothetical protein
MIACIQSDWPGQVHDTSTELNQYARLNIATHEIVADSNII